MMKTLVLPLIALASAAPFEPKTYTFELNGEKVTFNLINETECLATIGDEEKKINYTLVNNLLTFEKKEEGTYITFLVQENTEVLSLIDYDFFVANQSDELADKVLIPLLLLYFGTECGGVLCYFVEMAYDVKTAGFDHRA